MIDETTPEIPLLIAGPILRRLEPNRIAIWCALSQRCDIRFTLQSDLGTSEFTFSAGGAKSVSEEGGACGWQLLEAGERLVFGLLDVELEHSLPIETRVPYSLELLHEGEWRSLTALEPTLLYEGQDTLTLEVPGQVDSILHGSCRKPHHDSGDGLVAADTLMSDLINGDHRTLESRPSLLLMSGDQVYTDDVAGPMLFAIHNSIKLLGIFEEDLSDIGAAPMDQAEVLYGDTKNYYGRIKLLPEEQITDDWFQKMIKGARKPVFTSVESENHLITLAEHLAMYLLVWSPALWRCVGNQNVPKDLAPGSIARYEKERKVIHAFSADLDKVQRLFAHISVAMIFDDHDVTDDWNLNRDWEEAAYGNDFSRRIIGNALISYTICQAWGNCPEKIAPLIAGMKDTLNNPGSDSHDRLVQTLLEFRGWEYTWQTTPELVVLDTRTRRWPSDVSKVKPSGLLDWEAITDLQQTLYDKPAVLLVAAGPIFGVKLIELIQHTFAFFGKPLLVDAENWMGHSGTAQAILNVFRHSKTPHNFVILSGDVHYSFVYDVELKRHDDGPDIWQICSSGLKNEFPKTLLDVLDILNRWLFSPKSPLNYLTRRRRMRVVPRKPEGMADGRRLLNGAGIGVLELDEDGRPTQIRQLLANGTMVGFERMEDHAQYR